MNKMLAINYEKYFYQAIFSRIVIIIVGASLVQSLICVSIVKSPQKRHKNACQKNKTTLETRRARGDLIQTYKFITEKDDLPATRFFKLSHNKSTSGHKLKLFKERTGPLKYNFFSNRVINHWNSLNEHAVSSESKNAFKSRLAKFGF